MSDADPTATGLAAGTVSSWLSGLDAALTLGSASTVPCGTCTACCTSSQFIQIAPDEEATLARIPSDLLFPAPGLPEGHVVMGYDEHGHCPMFTGSECSIYADRPRTCRTYDCRVFAATGLEPDQDAHVDIARQARRWQFATPTAADRARRDAVHAAAEYLTDHRAAFAAGLVPTNPTQVAVLAIEIRNAFLRVDDRGHEVAVASPAFDEVAAAVVRVRG